MALEKPIAHAAAIAAAILTGACLCAPRVEAAYVITVEQAGSDVVATGSGSIDFDALALYGDQLDSSLIAASGGALIIGPAAPTDDAYYSGIAGPAIAFGTGDEFFADSGAGAIVGLGTFNLTSGGVVAVPLDYVSGAPLGTSAATFAGQTIASLGLTPGSYVWSWGSGPTADSFTLDIVGSTAGASVPEPATWAMMLLGLAGLMLLGKRGSRVRASAGASHSG